MTLSKDVVQWLDDEFPGLIEKHDVPGAAVAVHVDGEITDRATGILNTATGVEATVDSLFQIGSITKVWTATLVMQLVDEGLLDIDQPVRRYLPEFAVQDETATKSITTRQLLCHTAGFEGDHFRDTGRGDDSVEKYVATLVENQQIFPPGELFSYNNDGYCALGRVVEVLREKPYDACLQEHLFTPLGLTHAAASPYEAIMFRAAMGHVRPEPEADLALAPVWALARSNAPAGSMLSMRARDLLTFAAMHLNSGRGPDGTVVLKPETVSAMQEPQVDVPRFELLGDGWGLGWELFRGSSKTMIGHDGTTIGQNSFMRLVPEEKVAVALMVNGGNAVSAYGDVFSHLLDQLAGIELPALPEPPADPPEIDTDRFVGTYTADVIDMVVSKDDEGRVWLDQTPKGVFAEMGEEPERKELIPYRDDAMIPAESEGGMFLPHIFMGDDGNGRALYLHIGRALRRNDPAPV
jgi:CubicO group peptidase (beta-lactamase class C family)